VRIAAVETLRLGEFPNLVWAVLEDEAGNRGLGESFFGAEATEAYLHESAAPLLVGQEISGPEELRRRLRPYVGHQAPGAEIRGNSAVDIALWDLWGQRSGTPLWALMGGRSRQRIRAYNTCAGYRYIRAAAGQQTGNWGLEGTEGPYEDLDAFLNDAGTLAKSLMAEGFTAMKIWPFDFAAEESQGMAITPAQLAEGCAAFARIREAVGDRMQIMLELHSLWSAPAAVEIARAVAPHGVYWIEDPIQMANFGALADLRRQVPMRVTASETVAGRRQFLAMIEARAVDVVMLDLSWCGGITEAKAIAAIAEAAELPVAPHDCTGPVVWAASCHLSLHAPNALIQECVRAFFTGWYRELADGLPVFEAGTVRPAEGPGHGVRLKPEVWDRPDARRRRSG
jgi:L-alanine-DL-glutamate epimerase-like enolase superfamily enzyme